MLRDSFSLYLLLQWEVIDRYIVLQVFAELSEGVFFLIFSCLSLYYQKQGKLESRYNVLQKGPTFPFFYSFYIDSVGFHWFCANPFPFSQG